MTNLSGKWLAVHTDDPSFVGELRGSQDAASADLAAFLKEEGDAAENWIVAQFTLAAFKEFRNNGGSIEDLAREGNVIFTCEELGD